jgi:RNA polymerase sigma-70 factor (ECF subfamily)
MAFTEIDEKLLVQAYQAGDERAFDQIVRTQYNALYAHALRRLSQHEAAEDAVQDTLLRAYRALPNLDGDLALRAWLHRILTNVCHDEGNRRRRQQGLVEKVAALPEETADDPIEEAVLHDTVRIMSEALQDLPDAYREALVLRYVDGLSFREVAEATGVTEENARARVHRGRLALHKVLSRLAVLAAFIVPGMRRATQAPAATDAAVTPDVSLATQLTSHVVQAAPTVSRLADMSSAIASGKSALAAAAVTAVAAVSVPVAVHTVHDASKPQRPTATTAAPFQSKTTMSATDALPGAASLGQAAPTSTSVITTTTLPESLAHPFQGLKTAPVESSVGTEAPTTSTTSTTTPTPDSQPTVDAEVDGSGIDVEGSRPQFDISGTISLATKDSSAQGTIAGRMFMNDDGTSSSDDLVLNISGGALGLRFQGTITSASTDEAGVSYLVDGRYALTGGDRYNLPAYGAIRVSFTPAGTASDVRLVFLSEG